MADPRLARLSVIADLLRDTQLARLSALVAAREASLRALQDLSRPQPPAQDAAAFLAEAAFQRWADARRGDLARQIAAQDSAIATARKGASLAFARSAALARLRGG